MRKVTALLSTLALATTLTCNLNYYVDDVHYTGDVNNLILQWMKSGEYELTKENYEDYIAKEKAFYTSYDYDQLFGEQQ